MARAARDKCALFLRPTHACTHAALCGRSEDVWAKSAGVPWTELTVDVSAANAVSQVRLPTSPALSALTSLWRTQFYCREVSPFECEGVLRLSHEGSLSPESTPSGVLVHPMDDRPIKRAKPMQPRLGHSSS